MIRFSGSHEHTGNFCEAEADKRSGKMEERKEGRREGDEGVTRTIFKICFCRSVMSSALSPNILADMSSSSCAGDFLPDPFAFSVSTESGDLSPPSRAPTPATSPWLCAWKGDARPVGLSTDNTSAGASKGCTRSLRTGIPREIRFALAPAPQGPRPDLLAEGPAGYWCLACTLLFAKARLGCTNSGCHHLEEYTQSAAQSPPLANLCLQPHIEDPHALFP